MLGLCYKLNVSKSFIPTGDHGLLDSGFGLMLKSYNKGIDKLAKFKLIIAAENTWQGIIYDKWFYSGKAPPIINADLIPGLSKNYFIDLEANIWNYKNGKTSFDSCVAKNEKESCLSIFDTRSLHVDSRYVICKLTY